MADCGGKAPPNHRLQRAVRHRWCRDRYTPLVSTIGKRLFFTTHAIVLMSGTASGQAAGTPADYFPNAS